MLSASNISKFEKVQNSMVRVIIRQAKTSPTESLQKGYKLSSYSLVINANCMKVWEKAHELQINHPRKASLDKHIIPI